MTDTIPQDLLANLLMLARKVKQMKTVKIALLFVFSSLSVTASFVGFEGFLITSALGQHISPTVLAAIVTIVFQALLIVSLSKIHGDLGQERVSSWFIYALTCAYSIVMAFVFWFGVFFADIDAQEVNKDRFGSMIAQFSSWPAQFERVSSKIKRLEAYARDEYDREVALGGTCGNLSTGLGRGRRAGLRDKYVVTLSGIAGDAYQIEARTARTLWDGRIALGVERELRSFQSSMNSTKLSSLVSDVQGLIQLVGSGAQIAGETAVCHDDLLTMGLQAVYQDLIALEGDRGSIVTAHIPDFQDPGDIEQNFARATQRLSSIAMSVLSESDEVDVSYMDGIAFAFALLIEVLIFSISTWRGALYIDKPLTMSDLQFIKDWDDPSVYHVFGRTFGEVKVAPVEVHECLTEFGTLPDLLDAMRMRRCEIDRVTCLVFPYDTDEDRNEPLLRCLDHLEQGWSAAVTLEEQVPYDRLSPAVRSRLRSNLDGAKPKFVRIIGLNPLFWREAVRDNLRMSGGGSELRASTIASA
ncbi:MAG: hypothetical protein AAF004_04430 [Pseudomonadota bacterium]